MVPPPSAEGQGLSPSQFFGVFRYSKRAIDLVWKTNRRLTVGFALATLVAAVLPAAAAWVGRLIVDAVVAAMAEVEAGAAWRDAARPVLKWIAVEGVIMAGLAGAQRAISVCQSLLQAQLGYRVNEMILEKAVTLDLEHFEDSEFYDKLTRARRQASSRPVSLVVKTFGLLQNLVSVATFAILLLRFSPWAVLLLVLAGLPAFLVEAKYSGDAFRLFRWRSPESRRMMYLETVMANDGYAKEVQIFSLGPTLLDRYRAIFGRHYAEDRSLTLRRGFWGFVLGLVSTAAFYGAYAWIGVATVLSRITLGDMTMYLLLFKQGQSAVSAALSAIGGMYEDNLYLSNLYEYLEQPVVPKSGHLSEGPEPGRGVTFEGVTFTYPGADAPAVEGVDLELSPGRALALVGDNGSGKTTLIKLLTRLYVPQEGRILLDGAPLGDWDPVALRRRIAVVFQDFARYQFLAGENIGVGDVDALEDESRWAISAEQGLAAEFLERLPDRYRTQLGRWFQGGRELSGGQWQKVALARGFMRRNADIFVLDEPTAAMDAEAEAQVFDHVRSMTADDMVILISHRFSTVRMADDIVVLDRGRVTERGTHEELMDLGGRYSELFRLQQRGYL